ncbi:MAG: hypothetical protein KF752_02735 [Pirellulaceae bacterium]|nr:hypothetical protein [Pirellulaceae bacterium]
MRATLVVPVIDVPQSAPGDDATHCMNTSATPPSASELSSPDRWQRLLAAVSLAAYAVFVLTVSAGLLFCNSVTSFVIYSTLPQSNDEDITARVSQLFFFVMPVLLTFFEWYLLDLLRRYLRR